MGIRPSYGMFSSLKNKSHSPAMHFMLQNQSLWLLKVSEPKGGSENQLLLLLHGHKQKRYKAKGSNSLLKHNAPYLTRFSIIVSMLACPRCSELPSVWLSSKFFIIAMVCSTNCVLVSVNKTYKEKMSAFNFSHIKPKKRVFAKYTAAFQKSHGQAFF